MPDPQPVTIATLPYPMGSMVVGGMNRASGEVLKNILSGEGSLVQFSLFSLSLAEVGGDELPRLLLRERSSNIRHPGGTGPHLYQSGPHHFVWFDAEGGQRTQPRHNDPSHPNRLFFFRNHSWVDSRSLEKQRDVI